MLDAVGCIRNRRTLPKEFKNETWCKSAFQATSLSDEPIYFLCVPVFGFTQPLQKGIEPVSIRRLTQEGESELLQMLTPSSSGH